jgi:hypothetical protein
VRLLKQARALLRELPPHLRDMATFTLATGLRAANVTGLTSAGTARLQVVGK